MIELILEGHLKPRDLVAYFLIEHRSFFGVAGFTVGFWKLTQVKWGQSADLNASRKSYMELQKNVVIHDLIGLEIIF